MSIILNIETSTDVCSVSIGKAGETIALAEIQEPYAHASKLTSLIDSALKSVNITMNTLEAVAISKGPGSYTALRIGTSTAKGICYALDKPLIAIDTLELLAFAALSDLKDQTILYSPMIDARRMEVYTALFDANLQKLEDTQAMILDEASFQAYFAANHSILFCGNGAAKSQKVILAKGAKFHPSTSSAKDMTAMSYQAFLKSDFVDLAYFSPNYFKAPNITQPKKIL